VIRVAGEWKNRGPPVRTDCGIKKSTRNRSKTHWAENRPAWLGGNAECRARFAQMFWWESSFYCPLMTMLQRC